MTKNNFSFKSFSTILIMGIIFIISSCGTESTDIGNKNIKIQSENKPTVDDVNKSKETTSNQNSELDEDIPSNDTIYDLKTTNDATTRNAKVYIVKSKNIQSSEGENVMQEIMDTLYSKVHYESYLSDISFGKFKMNFHKGEVLEVDSYPVVEDDKKTKLYGHKLLDITKLTDMLQKIIPKEDLIKYDPIILNVIASDNLQHTSQGVAIPYEMGDIGKNELKSFFMLGLNNERIVEDLEEAKSETIIDSTKALIMHELFHTVGFLRHANTIENKQLIEYGNVFDILGYGSLSVSLNPSIRDYFNWLDDSNTMTLKADKPTSKNITLYPLNGGSGKRVVKIQIDAFIKYYVYFFGDDKYLLTNIKPNEDYEGYTGFNEPVTKEKIERNKKGIFIVKEDGLTNNLIENKDNGLIPSYLKGDIHDNKFFTIKDINMQGEFDSINFNLVIK